MTERRVELPVGPDEAYQRLLKAAAGTGKVEESSDAARYVVCKARYGLNPVRVRISVLSSATGDSSVIEFGGRGQDVWGVASRKVIDSIIQRL
ncbi:MAG: hypothetical protein GC157_03960 [Frankiales bacterium]|nr:hypothetical protein [Frankiales bacterium]